MRGKYEHFLRVLSRAIASSCMGEKSLRNGGDLDTTVIITNDYEGFRKQIESS